MRICKLCGSEYEPTGRNQKYCENCKLIGKKIRKKSYRKEHPEKRLEEQRQHMKKHPEVYRKASKKYIANNPDKVRESKRKYRENNKDKIKEGIKRYKKKYPEKYKLERKRRKHRRRRDLGFIPLNKSFENAHAHHIDKNRVIYIPADIHMSVAHNLKTGKNMELINKLALDFLAKQS